MGSYFGLLETAQGWLVDQGLPDASARSYMAGLFANLGRVAEGSAKGFAALRDEYSTRGGLNEQVFRVFQEEGRGRCADDGPRAGSGSGARPIGRGFPLTLALSPGGEGTRAEAAVPYRVAVRVRLRPQRDCLRASARDRCRSLRREYFGKEQIARSARGSSRGSSARTGCARYSFSTLSRCAP